MRNGIDLARGLLCRGAMRAPDLLVSALLMTLASGCQLYFGDDDPCDDGGDYAGPGREAPAEEGRRNPQSGQCEYFGSGGSDSGSCDACGNCWDEPNPGVPVPTWGFCESSCTGLDEAGCLATAGCRGIYGIVDGTDDIEPQYLACWQIDQGGGPQGEGCAGLDAYQCSTHDDCVAIHFTSGCSGGEGFQDPTCVPSGFEACADEPAGEETGCYSDLECDDGTHCNAEEVCLPPPGDCEGAGCDLACYGYCVPDDPDSGPYCTGLVVCGAPPPDCPAGTEPGLENGCWTGECVPAEDCQTEPGCEERTDEPSCLAHAGCQALYVGIGCSCDAESCSCEEWDFDACAVDDSVDPPAP